MNLEPYSSIPTPDFLPMCGSSSLGEGEVTAEKPTFTCKAVHNWHGFWKGHLSPTLCITCPRKTPVRPETITSTGAVFHPQRLSEKSLPLSGLGGAPEAHLFHIFLLDGRWTPIVSRVPPTTWGGGGFLLSQVQRVLTRCEYEVSGTFKQKSLRPCKEVGAARSPFCPKWKLRLQGPT